MEMLLTLSSIVEVNSKKYKSVYQSFGVYPTVLVIRKNGSILNCDIRDLNFEVKSYRIIPTVNGFKIFADEYSVELTTTKV
jgi:hypothetical protein